MSANVSSVALLEALPEFLPYIQVIAYIFLITLFGGIAMKGFRMKVRFYIRWPLILGSGFLALLFGTAISQFLQLSENLFFKILQVSTIISGVIGGVALAGAFYLVTKVVKPDKKRIWMGGGASIIVLIAVLSVVFFRGLPDIRDDIAAGTGLSKEALEAQKPGCVSPLILAAQYGSRLGELAQYNDTNAKDRIEKGSGQQVFLMTKVKYKDTDYIMALAFSKGIDINDKVKQGKVDLGGANICSASLTDFCSCTGLPVG